jgi:hypothetical protein
VKRWSVALALGFCASFALAGAGPNAFPTPIVIVYPLTGTGGTPAEVGSNVAILLSSKLADLGGITVKPYTPGTERPDYLTAAIAANADYYITGYLSPVGSDVSLITQIVSTHSGSVTFSSTAVVRTYADVVGQADTLRDAILRHAGRGFPAVEEPAAAPSGSAAPSGTGAQVNLSKALSHHARPNRNPVPSPSPSAATEVAASASASPSPAPSASASAVALLGARPTPAAARRLAARPSATAEPKARLGVFNGTRAGGLVTYVGGDGTSTQRNYAQLSFAVALRKVGLEGGALPVSSTDGVRYAGQLCDANPGSKAIFIGSLYRIEGNDGKPAVEFDVVAHNCAGARIASERAREAISGEGGLAVAIDRASAYVAAAFAKRLTTAIGSF